MWRAFLLALAPIPVLTLVGSVTGYQIGETACDDPEGELLGCIDDGLAGGTIGLVVGLLVGLTLAVVMLTRRESRSGAVTRRVLLAAIVGLAGVVVGFGLAVRARDEGGSDLLVELPGQTAQIAFTHSEDLSDEHDDDVRILDAAGFQARVVEDAQHPEWAPEGKRIAFDRVDVPYSRDIWVVTEDGTGEVRLTSYAGDDAGPAWSPDGRRIAFVRDDSDLYVMNADGSGLQRLSAGKADDSDPAWSPDGRWIAFSSTPEDGNIWSDTDLWIMRADGSGRRPLTRSPGYEFAPDWSSDGRRIAFVSGESDLSVNGIWVVNANGSGRRRLTRRTGEDYDGSPDWSPDGRWLAFERGISGYDVFCCGIYGIWVMDAEGRGAHQVTEGDDTVPKWRPGLGREG